MLAGKKGDYSDLSPWMGLLVDIPLNTDCMYSLMGLELVGIRRLRRDGEE